MASETPLQPVNGGTYGAVPHYNAAELPAPNPPPGVGPNGANLSAAQAPTQAPASEVSESGPSKDEVGWYFVEQYYTTMSRSPEKLHLFYNKKSQFVSGVETFAVSVSVGQRAIGDRIKEMGIENCKVRVTNVDSQESHDKSIVIQVIGEMSNKNEPHKKFVQTFVLAKQANGYYVLNDIFRYMAEDEEEEPEPETAEPEANAAPVAEAEIKTLTSSDDTAAQAKDAEIVDHKLEKSAAEQPAALSVTPAVPQVAVPESLTAASSQPAGSQKAASEVDPASDAAEIEPEKPKDPEPSPAPSSPPQEEATSAPPKEPAAPSKPAAPKTWASMLAGGAAKAAPPAAPAVPASGAASTPKKPAAANVPTPPNATGTPPAEEQALPSPGGWQTAGQDHGRKGNRQANPVSNARDGSIKAYVKNVTERVDGTALRSALAKYGKIEYFDISRQKSCAFVEFADQAGFNAAVAANPHNVSGEEIFVEERHVRPQSYGQGSFPARGGRGGMRGGAGGNMDGRNNSPGGSGRGGFKDGRGGYPPRGRGGMAARGRGMPQAA